MRLNRPSAGFLRQENTGLLGGLLFAFAFAFGAGACARAASSAVPDDEAALFDPEAVLRVEKLMKAAVEGGSTAQLAFQAAEQGMAAVWVAADKMDLTQDPLRRSFALLTRYASGARKSNRELLRLYDPPAYRAFYTPAGRKLQARISSVLFGMNASEDVSLALVMAAPESTLAWLNAQAEAVPANPDLLLDILRVWGGAVSLGEERQFVPQLQLLAARLATSEAINADERLLLGVIGFLSAVECRTADAQLGLWLRHANPTVRGAAADALARGGSGAGFQALNEQLSKEPDPQVRGRLAIALGRRGDPIGFQALSELLSRESDPLVQGCIAEALGYGPDEPAAGAACLRLFERTSEPGVRGALIRSAATSNWPARDQIIRQGLRTLDDEALKALTIKPVPGQEDLLAKLLAGSEGRTPKPVLLEALAKARVAAAIPALKKAMELEDNIAMRLKLIFALEEIGGNEAGTLLVKLLEETTDELEAEYVLKAVGHLKRVDAIPTLRALARNKKAPSGLRVQALWALGCMPDPSVRADLESILHDFSECFGDPKSVLIASDSMYHLRAVKPNLLLALLRTGSTTALDEIGRFCDESGPLEHTLLLGGLRDQKVDHPIIAKGLASHEFAVFYFAIDAAYAANPTKYRDRIRALAKSPFIKALADLGNIAWNLSDLLEKP